MDFEMDSTISPRSENFSIPIDQCVLDRLPDLDDFDKGDSDSEAEYSFGDDLSFNEGDDMSFNEGEGDCDSMICSSLYTIIEETEEELMSESSYDDDINDDLDLDCRIHMPRTVSLDAFLAKDETRHQTYTLNMTAHQMNESSEADDSETSFQLDELMPLRRNVSASSFASQDDDTKSVDSSSTAGSGSFRLAQRRLQKEFSLIKLKQAFEAAEMNSSFRKDDLKPNKCVDSVEQKLLNTSDNSQARNNLRSAISSSKVVLSVRKE